MSTFDTAGDPPADGDLAAGLDSENVASDGSDVDADDGAAETVDGALSPGSSATGSPTND